MAHKIREEGDYTYWSDGAQRYAKGNSLGKQAGGLAKRHPKAATSFDQLTVSEGKAMGKLGGKAKWEAKRTAISDAHAYALRSSHPDARTEEQGLRLLAEAEFTQGNEGEGASAVKARAQFYEQYTGGKREDKTIAATQINITVSPGAGNDLSRFAQLIPDVIEGEIIEEESSASQSPDQGEEEAQGS